MTLVNTVTLRALVVAGALCASSAHSATTAFVVDALTAGDADANVGDGICATAGGECTLFAALEEANALPAPVDDTDVIRIEFDAALEGDIIHDGLTPRMFNSAPQNTRLNDYLGSAAYLHVNALQPLTIDFDNRVSAVQHSDNEFSMLFIASDDVTVENFRNADKIDVTGGGFNDTSGIQAGAGGIVIGGSRVTIRNGYTNDASTDALEVCVGLTDGASDVLIEDFYCRGAAGFAVYVDEEATVSNVTLNRFEAQDGDRFGDVWLNVGESADNRTVLNGLTITDSEFRSIGNQASIVVRSFTTLTDFSLTDSRFLASDNPSIRVDTNAALGATTIRNNSSTNTGHFFMTGTDVSHAGVLNISDNILRGNLSDAIFLQSSTSGTVIENNQILNQRTTSLVAGVRIATGAFGSNNVIRGNLFEQADPTNRFAIWMRAQPNGVGGSGSSGWSIENNSVSNIFGSDFGPIYNDGDSDTLISGNTFGEGTRGAVAGDPAPENDDSFFVVNVDSFSNGKIQTWRPTGATYTGSSIRVAVGPVDPPLAGNAAPTNPVSIDVYYTASDLSETYLGRIPGTHSTETVFEFSSDVTSGAVRAQITDANGRSSQYSAAVALEEAVDAGADDDMDGLPNGAECTINLLGLPLVCPDSDGDGTPDYLDTDDDNDGIPTRTECPDGSPCVDTDGDGTTNHLDLDSDGDGIADAEECPELECRDTDGDGKANYVDTDSDGDSLDDAVECESGVPCTDADGDGVEDYLQLPPEFVARGTGGATGPWLLLLLAGVGLRRRLVRSALLLGALTASGNAMAEPNDWTSRFYGGAQLGGLFTDFDDKGLTRALQNAAYDVTQTNSEGDDLGYGLWLGYALTSSLGLELSYLTGPDEWASFEGSVNGDLEGALQVAEPYLSGYGDTYALRARYHHALSQNWFVSPRIGVGYTETRQTLSDNRGNQASLSDDGFSWQAGAGIHRVLSRNWSAGLQLDYVQGSSDNAYALLSAVIEWRFPGALPAGGSAEAPSSAPVKVVPPVVESREPAPVVQSYESSYAPVVMPEAGLENLGLEGVKFESNGSELTSEARLLLDEVLPGLREVLRNAPQLQVEVAGHTDSSGNAGSNQRLSQVRAQAVRDYLVAGGIQASRVSVVGYGSSEPVASNDSLEGRAKNRRVELREAN